MSHSFLDVAALLPLGAFMKLQDDLASPETAKYVRTITGVAKENRSKNPDRQLYIGRVKWEPREGKFEDPGFLPTSWLNDPISRLICEIAKENVGSDCLIYQRNRDKSEDQPSGFREICWIEPLNREKPSQPTEARREPDPPRQQPAAQREPEPDQGWQANEGPRYDEEPFRRDAGEWMPGMWGEYPT